MYFGTFVKVTRNLLNIYVLFKVLKRNGNTPLGPLIPIFAKGELSPQVLFIGFGIDFQGFLLVSYFERQPRTVAIYIKLPTKDGCF